MSALGRLQRDFQDYVYSCALRMQDRIVGTHARNAQERLNIYADAYRLRLLEVLGNDLPGLRDLAGADKFERLARAYIEAHPSVHFNVRWYGAELADFLRRSLPWTDEPALAEMAEFEWAMTLAFDAGDEPVVGVDTFAGIPPEHWPGMVAIPQHGLQRIALRWNVPAFREAVDQEELRPELQQLQDPVPWQVWRKDYIVYYRPLQTDEAWALAALHGGASFAELCEGLCTWLDATEVAERAAKLLRRWLEDGLIREVRLPSG